jgi:AcrR family transcriptional regulator
VLGTTNRDRQAERREATRREILDAAWDLARERGLNEITLRDVAERVGMRAPSLYTHFASKNAIYDAMFAQAWSDFERLMVDQQDDLPDDPRKRVLKKLEVFFDFQMADLARYQLMNLSVIPGFEPSPESFEPSQRVVDHSVALLSDIGVKDRGWVEILFAMVSGLISQQHANDPGGDSRRVLLGPAVEMWADAVGLPKTRSRAGANSSRAGSTRRKR